MMHPHDDDLILLAYGELDVPAAAAAEQHVAGCAECRARFARLEEARTALAWATADRPRQFRRLPWITAALAAAAVLAGILVTRDGRPRPDEVWRQPYLWSATAGYIAGGAGVVEIDAQLTRLEKERYHGLPD